MDASIECYKYSWIMESTRKAIPNAITNSDILESRILKYVGNYIIQSPDNHKKHRAIRRIIRREVYNCYKRNRIEIAGSIEAMTMEDEGSSYGYEVEDEFVPHDDSIIASEIINALSDGKEKKSFILAAWLDGYTDDTLVSRMMADKFGGQARSHCKYIERFRKECRQRRDLL